MSEVLLAPHYPLDREATYLTASAAAGQKVLIVKSSAGIVANDYLVIENIGGENAELAQVDSVGSLTSITLKSNLNFTHAASNPIFLTPYNQIKFYYDTSASGTFANQVTGSPVDVDVDQPDTILNDASGSSSRYYKFTYYNETTAAETNLADCEAVQGGAVQYLCSVEDVKLDCGIDIDDKTKDELIQLKIQAATDYIVNFTGVAFIKRVITNEYIDIEEYQRSVFPKYSPIYSVESVYDNGTLLTYDADPDVTEYDWYTHGEIRRSGDNFTAGNRQVKVSYTAWRDTTPEEIKHACAVIAGIWAGIKKRTYENAEGVEGAVRVNTIPKDIMETLGFYRRRSI